MLNDENMNILWINLKYRDSVRAKWINPLVIAAWYPRFRVAKINRIEDLLVL